MNTHGQQIESPLYAFNNVMTTIVKNLEQELKIKNLNECLFFYNESINFFGWLELKLVNKIVQLNIKKELTHSDLSIVNLFYEKYNFICREFAKYIMMYNRIAKGCDNVPQTVVNGVIYDILTNKYQDKKYLLPFKNKLSDLDKELNIYNKFEVFLTVHKHAENSSMYILRIKKCMSSDLCESKSINNLKYLDVDTIHEVNVTKANIKKTIEELFYYGNI